MIQGGPERPCRSASELRAYEEEHGQRCPRVELDPENAAAAEVLSFLFSEETRALAPGLFEALSADLPPEEKAAVLSRIHGALHDRTVVQLRERLLEQALRKAQRDRGSNR